MTITCIFENYDTREICYRVYYNIENATELRSNFLRYMRRTNTIVKGDHYRFLMLNGEHEFHKAITWFDSTAVFIA